MVYTSPQLTELISQSKLLKEKCTNETPERLKLIAILETVSNLIEAQSQTETANKDELHAYLLGAYMYCHERIYQEFYIHSPEFRNGYIYNSGSPLYSGLTDILKMSNDNNITARERLIYINKFHQFVDKNKDTVNEQLKNIDITSDKLQVFIRAILTKQLVALTNPITKIVNAVPTEKAVTNHMNTLPEDYKKAKALSKSRWWLFAKKENPDRIFLTQLAQAVAAYDNNEDETFLPLHGFTHSQCTKMGMLLYISNSIENEYWARSPTNSTLYCEAKQILNMPDEDNLDAVQKADCLAAFKSYVKDLNKRIEAVAFGREHFGDKNLLEHIDTKLDQISCRITHMEDSLKSTFAKDWPVTNAFATIGMLLGSSPGYAAGSMLGAAISEGEPLRPVRNIVGGGINQVATAYFGRTSSASYYSGFVAEIFVSATLSRAFAKVFELVGMAVGAAAGGAIGFTFDLSYKGLRKICVRYLDFYDHHPEQMRNADPELIKCLLELPAESFSPDKQNQIRYTSAAEQVTPRTGP